MTSRFTGLFSGSNSAANSASASASAFDPANCPPVEIRPGTATLAVASKPNDPTALDLRHQLSFVRMARQCSEANRVLTIKVGVQGRVVLGPAGAPGMVSVPLRYAIVHEGPEPKTILTKFKRFSVTLPPGETNVLFTDIEETLSVPLPDLFDLESYVVYVGFDDLGDRTERTPAAKKSVPRKK